MTLTLRVIKLLWNYSLWYNKVFKHVNPFQKCYIKWDLGQYRCLSDRGGGWMDRATISLI